MTRKSKVKSVPVKPTAEVNAIPAEEKPVKPKVPPLDPELIRQWLATLPQVQYDQAHLDQLRNLYQGLVKTYRFRPGQLVQWKEGLKNKKLPELNQPAIIIDVLEQPRIESTGGIGSTYYAEPLDLILGLITPEGEFLTFYYDQRRFEPYE